MKKTLLFAGVIALFSITTSCQKCATCTFNDPEKGTITAEVCSKGEAYNSAIKVYEDTDWTCAK